MLLSSISLALTRLGGGGPSLDFQFLSGSLDSRITFTRASTAMFFNSSGVLTSASNDVARFDYNPATLAPLGLLIEESRTNLLLRSEDFSDASWVKIRATVTVNATTAPTGTAVADKLVEDTSTNTHESYQSVAIVANTLHTVTFYLKAAERTRAKIWLLNGAISSGANASVNLGAGTITAPNLFGTGSSASSSITNVGNGWYRCSIACIVDAASTTARAYIVLENAAGNDNYTGDGTSGLFVWGAQLEAGAFPTSYIPTTTTALTRAADVASVNTLSPWFNAVEGTIFVEASNAQLGTSLFSTDDGTASNRIVTYFNVANSPAFRVVSGGVDQANFSAGTITQNATFKLSTAYATNDFAASLNGAAAVTDTSGTVPSGQTTARIGSNVSSANFINGYLRRITYYPRRLANAELQAITA
jgi:hypothetical protein